ncbi:MAG: hypothetical protein PHR43_07365 [Dehalococcoidales bacterium]|nr:hypothetical protein [Dehalococcoidales bacterium]
MYHKSRTQQRQTGATATALKPGQDCRHYWLIESPSGSRSHGVCKLCNAEREFDNLLYHYSPEVKPRTSGEAPVKTARQIAGIHRFPLA